MIKAKKKRGRKPKNIIQQSSNADVDNKIDNNLIIRIKVDNYDLSDLDNVVGYADNKDNVNYSDFHSETNHCWNCCHVIKENVNYLLV